MSTDDTAQTPEQVLADLRAEFGDEGAEQMLKTIKAMRSLVNVWAVYTLTPDDSAEEQLAQRSLETMLGTLKTRPEHAVALIEVLLGLVHDLRNGGSYEGFLESLGLNIDPARDPKTGASSE